MRLSSLNLGTGLMFEPTSIKASRSLKFRITELGFQERFWTVSLASTPRPIVLALSVKKELDMDCLW